MNVPFRKLLVWALVLGTLGVAGTVRSQSAGKLRILITNDDGIAAPGIVALVEALSPIADTVVVAPAENRSGASHSTEALRGLLRVTPFERAGAVFGYAVSGTPADAARFGLLQMGKDKPFDLVISGINRGENVGLLAHLSGTVGAAKEAVYHGVAAIAVSQSARRGDEYSTAARITAAVALQVRDRGLPPGVLLSINVPAGELRGTVVERMAGSELEFLGFEPAGNDGETALYRPQIGFRRPESGGDTQAFLSGYVTITPIGLDWTDYRTLAALAGWNLDGLIEQR